MSDKAKRILCRITNSVVIAGVIILLIGLYYSIIKAGIPYQDPPLELQIEYAVNQGVGKVLTGTGLLTALCGSVVRLALWRI